MVTILRQLAKPRVLRLGCVKTFSRTFLSPAYPCKEIWDNRLNNPLLQKINPDILYHELDQRFQKFRQISAIDVDIFANSVKDNLFIDELMDLVHKLRLSAQTGNTLDSTPHAVIRLLLDVGKTEELLQALNDRLNYGLFLDDFTANILMDRFWKDKNFMAGCLVASQMMLQEDFKHPLTKSFALLHCYNYLLKPGEWLKVTPPEEPEEEVKIRVNYLRNPYNDNHFDLTDPLKIVGKTLATATKGEEDILNKSFNVVGSALFGKEVGEVKNISLIKEIIDLLPDDNGSKSKLVQAKLESADVQGLLEKQVAEQAAKTSERDIATQCELYKEWEEKRARAIEEQRKQLEITKRLAEIETIKQQLEVKEQKLWFFEKEEDIELKIEAKIAAKAVKDEKKKKVAAKETEEDYVPPEIRVNRTT